MIRLFIFIYFCKIKAKYAFGNREFGFRKTSIYKEALRCPECHHESKLKMVGKNLIKDTGMIDPDFGNEMNCIVLEDAPVCMALKGPSQSSVWYNQSGKLGFFSSLFCT